MALVVTLSVAEVATPSISALLHLTSASSPSRQTLRKSTTFQPQPAAARRVSIKMGILKMKKLFRTGRHMDILRMYFCAAPSWFSQPLCTSRIEMTFRPNSLCSALSTTAQLGAVLYKTRFQRIRSVTFRLPGYRVHERKPLSDTMRLGRLKITTSHNLNHKS